MALTCTARGLRFAPFFSQRSCILLPDAFRYLLSEQPWKIPSAVKAHFIRSFDERNVAACDKLSVKRLGNLDFLHAECIADFGKLQLGSIHVVTGPDGEKVQITSFCRFKIPSKPGSWV